MTEFEEQTLLKIVSHCQQIQDYLGIGDFYKNPLVMDGVTLRVMAIGELVKRLSEEFRKETNEAEKTLGKTVTDWRGLAGIRDFVAHQYDAVDFEIVYETATTEIKPLKEICEYMLRTSERR